MASWLDSQGNYYEGDRASLADRSVPQRPSPDHIFVDGAWVEDVEKVAAKQSVEAKAKLAEIDLKSIRSIREWLATQPDCPKFLSEHENLAVAERAKLITSGA